LRQKVTELWTIYLIIFCASALAVQVAFWIFTEGRRNRKAVNRRLVLSVQNNGQRDVYEALKRERGLSDFESERLRYLNDFLTQTGLRFDRTLLIGSAFALSAFYFILLGFLFHFGFLTFFFTPILAVISLAAFFVVTRAKRIARFSIQLPDAIDVIIRGVKSGYPFTIALELVANEMPDPVGTEFGLTSDEIAFGRSISAALDNLYHRVGQKDLLFFVMAAKIQLETGGSLAEVLSRLARLLRQREKLRLKVGALSAEGRLSAFVLSAMPFILITLVNVISPGYYGEILQHPATLPAAIVALALLLIGNLVMYRMVNFKV
jgi:tight adherence protein B